MTLQAEIVFEDVPANLVPYLIDCVRQPNDPFDLAARELIEFLKEPLDGACTLRCPICWIENNTNEGYIRLSRFKGIIDVEFSWELNSNVDLANHEIASAWRTGMTIASTFKLKRFFGGLEPAADEDTRFFTNENAGPLYPKGMPDG